MHYGILRVKIEVAEVGEIAEPVEIADAAEEAHTEAEEVKPEE